MAAFINPKTEKRERHKNHIEFQAEQDELKYGYKESGFRNRISRNKLDKQIKRKVDN